MTTPQKKTTLPAQTIKASKLSRNESNAKLLVQVKVKKDPFLKMQTETRALKKVSPI